jgi:hypothetical protein
MTAWALKRKLNSRSELEITKITLQLAGDLRSICVQKWVRAATLARCEFCALSFKLACVP